MKEEWNLSGKAQKDLSNNPIPNYYWEKDVKEFIRRLIADEYINSNGEASKRIIKLAGDKLVEVKEDE